MRRLSSIVLGLCLLAAVGCGGVGHRYTSVQPVGTALPVEVSVKHKADQTVYGTVHYRVSGTGAYERKPMQLRAGQLWAMLPTEDVASQDTVEYYVDVNLAGKLHALGSPGSPYVVTFMDEESMILASLREEVYASDTLNEVRIVLLAWNEPIGQPFISYQLPGVPGEIHAPMEADGYGNYQIIIPPHAVSPGIWRYAIEFALNGTEHRLPRHGTRSFTVTQAYDHPLSVEVETEEY
jgi:hypothetical protein